MVIVLKAIGKYEKVCDVSQGLQKRLLESGMPRKILARFITDIRIVASELDYLLYEPMKEFITMAILLIGNIPLLYFLNRSWFNTLMFHPVGKLILAVTGVVIFVSLAGGDKA